jgi:hypothetical protein
MDIKQEKKLQRNILIFIICMFAIVLLCVFVSKWFMLFAIPLGTFVTVGILIKN